MLERKETDLPRITRVLAIYLLEEKEEKEETEKEVPTEYIDGKVRVLLPEKWSIGIIIGIFLLTLLGATLVLPLCLISATVTIVADHKPVRATASIQVPVAQIIAPIHEQASASAQTTGTGHQIATYAHGSVTFFNALQSPQHIPTGMLLVGKSGVHIITDEEAEIPAGDLTTNGQASVAAHVTTIGSGGNIPAADFSGVCCLDYISARSSQFTGGKDDRIFQVVSEHDVNTLTQQVTQQATQQVTQQTQIAPGNTAVQSCSQNVTPSAPVGSEAQQVTVQATVSCTIDVYKRSAVEQIMSKRYRTIVEQQAGARYAPDENPKVQVIGHTIDGTTLTLSMSVYGEAHYAFSQQEQMAMKQEITGDQIPEAILRLRTHQGVQSVKITTVYSWGSLPVVPEQITVHLT